MNEGRIGLYKKKGKNEEGVTALPHRQQLRLNLILFPSQKKGLGKNDKRELGVKKNWKNGRKVGGWNSAQSIQWGSAKRTVKKLNCSNPANQPEKTGGTRAKRVKVLRVSYACGKTYEGEEMEEGWGSLKKNQIRESQSRAGGKEPGNERLPGSREKINTTGGEK